MIEFKDIDYINYSAKPEGMSDKDYIENKVRILRHELKETRLEANNIKLSLEGEIKAYKYVIETMTNKRGY